MGNTQNQNIDLGSLLQSLLATRTVDQSKIPGESQDAAPAKPNAYQKGVEKALSEQGYKHGAEALASGVNPNDIVSHEAMQPPGSPAGDIRPLTITGNAQNQQDGNNALAQIVNQPSQLPNTPQVPLTGLLSKLLGVDLQPDVTGQRLQNQASVQKIQAGQPAEIAVPQAQAAEINQKIAGAVPLQPKDIIGLNVDTYTAALKANQDAYTNSNTEVANLSKTLEILGQQRSGFGKAIGGNTDLMKSLKQVIAAKTMENQKIGKNQKTLMDHAPKVGNQPESGFKVIGVR